MSEVLEAFTQTLEESDYLLIIVSCDYIFTNIEGGITPKILRSWPCCYS